MVWLVLYNHRAIHRNRNEAFGSSISTEYSVLYPVLRAVGVIVQVPNGRKSTPLPLSSWVGHWLFLFLCTSADRSSGLAQS